MEESIPEEENPMLLSDHSESQEDYPNHQLTRGNLGKEPHHVTV